MTHKEGLFQPPIPYRLNTLLTPNTFEHASLGFGMYHDNSEDVVAKDWIDAARDELSSVVSGSFSHGFKLSSDRYAIESVVLALALCHDGLTLKHHDPKDTALRSRMLLYDLENPGLEHVRQYRDETADAISKVLINISGLLNTFNLAVYGPASLPDQHPIKRF